MKFKNAVYRSAVIIIIIALSLLIGYAYSFIGHKADLASHPREFTEYVEKYSAQYGVPEYIVYAVILDESDFVSNYVSENGKIGLMQLSPSVFRGLAAQQKEDLESGILYDPETNIRYGTYYLSYLFTEFGRWNTVLAAYRTDADTVELWLEDPRNTDGNGNLTKIPEPAAEKYVDSVLKTAELYKKLYY